MRTVRVKCRSLKGSTLLMAPMSEAQLAGIRDPAKRPPVDKDRPLEDEAASQIYRDPSGRIGLPINMLRKTLVLAGTKVPLKGKTNVSKADGSTMMYSFLWLLGDGSQSNFLPFTNILSTDPEEQKKFWRVLTTRGSQTQARGKGGGAVCIVRPEFPEWELTVVIRYDETRANEKVIKLLFQEAGLTQGLGSWRPNKGGDHGQFETVEWTDITGPAAAGASTKEPAATAAAQ